MRRPAGSASADAASHTREVIDEPSSRAEEADPSGQLAQGSGAARRRGLRWIGAACAIVLVAVASYGVWQADNADSDSDGLRDRVEASGWHTPDGREFRTDPDKADTDGDGLTDADEAGARVTAGSADDVYVGYSDPLVVDTDGDRLTDAGEADLGLGPRDRDSDDDALTDGYEVDVVGSRPDAADTDGDGLTDGYEDANRESQGLDPLVADEKVSAAAYVADFLKGFVAGDLAQSDSLAWLVGDLASEGALSVVGLSAVGAARDAVASAIHGDWVGAGFGVLGAVPPGKLTSLPRKATAFLSQHPRLAASVARMIARANVVPEPVRLQALRTIYPGWDELVRSGATDRTLLALAAGRTNLDELVAALRRSAHRSGPAVAPAATASRGESLVERLTAAAAKTVKKLVRVATDGSPAGCGGNVRILDEVVDGIAHETKVGFVPWSTPVARQIRCDAWAVRTGQVRGAHWHFLTSSYTGTVGADPRVLDLLDEAGIPYTIHLPAGS